MKLGEVVHGLVVLLFYGLNIIHHKDSPISIHSDGNLNAFEQYPLST